MKTLYSTSLALAVAAGLALPLAGSANAAMGGALPSTQILPVEQAQFFYLGHNFCWYDAGWQGPGWYRCNYAWRSGYGWGGGDGWRGWNRGQWRGSRGGAGYAPHQAPQNNIVRTPQYHAPMNNIVRTPSANIVRAPQLNGGGAPHGVIIPHGASPGGAGPKGGGAPGAHPCPPGGKC